jgi:hypothetical protein
MIGRPDSRSFGGDSRGIIGQLPPSADTGTLHKKKYVNIITGVSLRSRRMGETRDRMKSCTQHAWTASSSENQGEPA